MPDRGRTRRARSPARYIAPLALLAVIAGIYLVVHYALASTKHVAPKSHSESHPLASSTATGPRHKSKVAVRPTFYVVRPGDNLYLIAQRTKVALATLEALNPTVSATALHVGQRLTLRR